LLKIGYKDSEDKAKKERDSKLNPFLSRKLISIIG